MAPDDRNEAGGGNKAGDGGAAAPPSGRDDPRLGRIRDELARLRRKPRSQAGSARMPAGGLSGLGLLMRMGSEFVGGVVVGFVIGYTIDRLFGTTPWGMVAFLLIGVAAGTLNVMRAAGVVPERFPSAAPPDLSAGGKSGEDGRDGDRGDED